MLKAIIDDAGGPVNIAKLAKGKMKNKQKELEEALVGLVGKHKKMLLTLQLKHNEFMDQQITELNQEIEECMHPFDKEPALLATIPGVGRRIAEDLVAEIGVDMDRFPSDAHISYWVGISPGNNESAVKRKSGKQPKETNRYILHW